MKKILANKLLLTIIGVCVGAAVVGTVVVVSTKNSKNEATDDDRIQVEIESIDENEEDLSTEDDGLGELEIMFADDFDGDMSIFDDNEGDSDTANKKTDSKVASTDGTELPVTTDANVNTAGSADTKSQSVADKTDTKSQTDSGKTDTTSSSSDSGSSSSSGSESGGNQSSDLIVDIPKGDDSEPADSYDASQGRVYETPRIPIN